MGIAGFFHDPNRQSAFASLKSITEVFAEASNLRPSQTFYDNHLCCVAASLAFQNLEPCISPNLAVWLDGEIYDFGEAAREINLSETAAAMFATL